MKKLYRLSIGLIYIMVLIASLIGCKKSNPIVGCSDKLAVNYNGSDSCSYSNSAFFYTDMDILPSGSPPIIVALNNSPSSQGQSIYGPSIAECGSPNGTNFTQ